MFQKFVETRLFKKPEHIYSPVTWHYMKTGVNSQKKSPQAISVLKEDN